MFLIANLGAYVLLAKNTRKDLQIGPAVLRAVGIVIEKKGLKAMKPPKLPEIPVMPSRAGGWGASDVAALMGLSRYDPPLKAYLSYFDSLPDKKPSRFMTLGHILEPLSFAFYCSERPEIVAVEAGERVKAPEPISFCWATPDRIVTTKTGEKYLVELKNVGPHAESDWADSAPYGGAPLEYRLQCYFLMLATGYRRCDLFAWLRGSDLKVCRTILYSENIANQIIESILEFKEQHVDALVPPTDIKGRGFAGLHAAAVPSRLGKELVSDDPFISKVIRTYKRFKSLDAALELLKDSLRTVLDDAEALEHPLGRITYKTSKNGNRPLRILPNDED